MSSARILIVEDESVAALFLRLMLEKAGHRIVATVMSGEEAIEVAGEHRPDVVLMDIMLDGDLNGIEAAGKIEELYGVPSVFMTAYTREEFRSNHGVAEAVEPLQKPVQQEELMRCIDDALGSGKAE